MDVRTNEPHRFAESIATDPANQFRFKVQPLPKIDHAAVAIQQAKENYLRQFPNADLEHLLWTIELVDESGEVVDIPEKGQMRFVSDVNVYGQTTKTIIGRAYNGEA